MAGKYQTPSTVYKSQFIGGEVSPSLYGRSDVSAFQTGAEKIRNMFVKSQGSLINRNGTTFIGFPIHNIEDENVRGIPFEFNDNDTYSIILTHRKMQVVRNNGLVLNDTEYRAASITSGETPVVTTSTPHSFANGDHVILVGSSKRFNLDTANQSVTSSSFNSQLFLNMFTYKYNQVDALTFETYATVAFTGDGSIAVEVQTSDDPLFNTYTVIYSSDPKKVAGLGVSTSTPRFSATLNKESILTYIRVHYVVTDGGFETGAVRSNLKIGGNLTTAFDDFNGTIFVASDKTATTFKLKDIDGNYVDFTGFYHNPNTGRFIELYSKSTPWEGADLNDLKYVQSGDTITITHPDYVPYNLIRQDHNVWKLEELNFEPDILPPERVYVDATHYVSATIDGLTNDNPGQISFAKEGSPLNPQTKFRKGSVGFIRGEIGMDEVKDKVYVLDYNSNYDSQTYVLNNTDGEGVNTSDFGTYTGGGEFVGDTLYRYRITAVKEDGTESRPTSAVLVACKSMSEQKDQGTPSPKVNVSWFPSAGAFKYNVYRQEEVQNGQNAVGEKFYYIGETYTNLFVDANRLPDKSKTPPTAYNPFLEPIIERDITNITQEYDPLFTTNVNHGFKVGDVVEFADLAGITELNNYKGYVTYVLGTTFRIKKLSDDTTLDTTNYGKYRVPISGITKSTKCTITFSSPHDFVIGDYVYVTGVLGMTEINSRVFRVGRVPSTTQIVLKNLYLKEFVNSTDWSTYTSAGSVRSWYGNVKRKNPKNSPATCTYFQQRKVFAGSKEFPNGLWFTRLGSYNNMDKSDPTVATDSITYNIADTKVQQIKHLVPMSSLMILTSNGCFKIEGQQGEGLSAKNLDIKPQGSEGSSDIAPLKINSDVIYLQKDHSDVFSLAYDLTKDVFSTTTLVIKSEHLFLGYRIKQWCSLYTPDKLVVALRDDGKLLCLTYNLKANIAAWTVWESPGNSGVDEYISIWSVPENGVDTLYAMTRRRIVTAYGDVYRKFIERLEPRTLETNGQQDVSKMFFMDCGVKRQGEDSESLPATLSLMRGLNHLEGCYVCVVVDGSYQGVKQVRQGMIPLSPGGVNIYVGLPYVSEVTTLPIDSTTGGVMSKRKSINEVQVVVNNTAGLEVSADGVNYSSVADGSIYATDKINLKTGILDYKVRTSSDNTGRVYLRQKYPYPCSILGVEISPMIEG